MKIGVMRGDLRDFDLAQVLQVVGIGRQYMCVEVRRDSSVLGSIFVKSGHVVKVDAPDAQGREALSKLVCRSDGQFHVFRLETPDNLPEPLGALQVLLLEALNDNDQRPSPALPTSRSVPGPIAPPINGQAKHPRSGIAIHDRVNGGQPNVAATVQPQSSSTARASTQVPARAQVSAGKILAVASPKGGCGKTTVALNLALSLARQGRSVMLVDADLNGDILSVIDARKRAEAGAFEVLLGLASPDEALLKTILPNFQILPAVGRELPNASLLTADYSRAWGALLLELSLRAELVIVDTPAGMFGVTQQVLQASTHVLGVLQAEVVANRSFVRFSQSLDMIPLETRPEVVGIVINMLQTTHSASLNVFQGACTDLPSKWLFDTSIPRHPVFLESTAAGVPVRHLDEQSPPPVAWLFDNLASEIVQRLHLQTAERQLQSLLI